MFFVFRRTFNSSTRNRKIKYVSLATCCINEISKWTLSCRFNSLTSVIALNHCVSVFLFYAFVRLVGSIQGEQ